MFTLHCFYSTPEISATGDMPLKATSLEEAKAEALSLAKPWGWLKRGKKRFMGSLSIYDEHDKRRADWSTLEAAWYDLEG